MRIPEASVTGVAANDDGIALNQTPGAAGNLTFNGDGGATVLQTKCYPDASEPPFYKLLAQTVAVLDPPRQVSFVTASDESSKTITVYGYDRSGMFFNETITGPNATTGKTTKIFKIVTRIAVSAAFTGNVKAGWDAVGYSRWIFIGHKSGNSAYGKVRAVATGTVNYDIEATSMSMNLRALYGEGRADSVPTYTGGEVPDDVDGTTIGAGKTASFGADLPSPWVAIRIKLNSGSGTVKLRYIPTSPV